MTDFNRTTIFNPEGKKLILNISQYVYKDMPILNTKEMNTNSHTTQKLIEFNQRFHEDLLEKDYAPIASRLSGGKRQIGKYVLAKDTELKGSQVRYNIHKASEEGEMEAEYAYRLCGDGHVGILLDGKLALIDFDDKERPNLYKSFEEKFPFLKNAHFDRNPEKNHSFHYLIPDDPAFANQMGNGTITGAKQPSFIHLIDPAQLGEKYKDPESGLELYYYEDNTNPLPLTNENQHSASVKVDFKKIYGDGYFDMNEAEKHFDNDTFGGTRFATYYGGDATPAYSTISCREQIRELPPFDEYVALKDDPSYADFICYMNTVFHAREKYMPPEVVERIKKEKKENPSKPTPYSQQVAAEFKELNEECFNYIIDKFPSSKGFKLKWKKFEGGIYMIDLGREKVAKKCPFICRHHKSNNTYLIYYSKSESLFQRCFDGGCSGKQRRKFYRENRSFRDLFLEGANHRNYQKDENGDFILKEGCFEDCDMDVQQGKVAVAKELNRHLCMIMGQSKTEYIRYGYGSGGYSRKGRDDLTKVYEDQEFFVQKYKKEQQPDGNTIKSPLGKPERINPIECWLKTDFDGKDKKETIDFKPDINWDGGGTIFNTFSGFTITKEIADMWVENKGWDKEECMVQLRPLLEHIMNIWCDTNPVDYEYVLNWFAWCLQRPCEKTKVCLCVKSTTEGSGKGCVIDKMVNIIGDQHAISLEEFPTGFNEIIADKCFLNFDEATWGGKHGKNEDGILKHFITESKINRKQKFKDDIKQSAYHNICITTNKSFFAPVDIGSRRYYCLSLNNKYGGVSNEVKNAYFDKIWKVPAELWAWFLYNRPLDKFNPRIFDTSGMEALKDAAMSGMGTVSAWWYECLLNEYIYETKMKRPEPPFDYIPFTVGFDCEVKKDAIYNAYKEWCGTKQYCEKVGMFWSSIKHHIPAEVLAHQPQGTDGKRSIRVPSLELCRGWWSEGFRSVCKCGRGEHDPNCSCSIKVYQGTNITGWVDEEAEAKKLDKDALEEALRKIHKEYEKKKEDDKKPKVKKIKKKHTTKRGKVVIKKRNIKVKVEDPRPNLDGNLGTDDEIETETSDLDVGIEPTVNEVLQEGWGEGNDQSGY